MRKHQQSYSFNAHESQWLEAYVDDTESFMLKLIFVFTLANLFLPICQETKLLIFFKDKASQLKTYLTGSLE